MASQQQQVFLRLSVLSLHHHSRDTGRQLIQRTLSAVSLIQEKEDTVIWSPISEAYSRSLAPGQ